MNISKVNTPDGGETSPEAVQVSPVTELAFETGLTILGGGVRADESHLHAGHNVHPHAHPDTKKYGAHCSGRWFCQTCTWLAADGSETRGVWFTGRMCA